TEARLLMLAILAAGPGDLLDCYSEPIRGGNGDRLYTVELVNEEGTRWFALHSKALREDSIVLIAELRRQFAPPPALPAP
ncbi:MAG TPA: hypothetical protein VN752_06760, partial [Solirubrobacterales bacterium]|nr:hypothetical protein [Solirubrobacterales bacterium]